MNRQRLPLPALLLTVALPLGILPVGCASASGNTAMEQEDLIKVTMHELPLVEVVKLAQGVTGKVYTFDRDAMAAGPFSIVGEVQCPRDEFDEFFTKLLSAKGLQVNALESDTGTIHEITTR